MSMSREEFLAVLRRSPLWGPVREAWMRERRPYDQDAYVAGWDAALAWKEAQDAQAQ